MKSNWNNHLGFFEVTVVLGAKSELRQLHFLQTSPEEVIVKLERL